MGSSSTLLESYSSAHSRASAGLSVSGLLQAIRRSLECHRNRQAVRRLLFRLRDSASLNLTLHQ